MRYAALLRSLLAPLLAIVLVASAASAQTVDPGMSRDQVVERLGRPMGERTTGPRTYLFFRNGCEQRCGMHDLVVLENDAVVDAIFRKAGRHYSGESSSPAAVPPRVARRSSRASAAPSTPPKRPARPAERATPTKRPQGADRAALPPGTRRGGIVIGDDASAATATAPAAAAPVARRTVRSVAGSQQQPGRPGDSAAAAARPRPQAGGDVRVPIVPRDTQLGIQPREQGKRTLPGPVTVPVTPRDTQVARPASPAPRQQPPPRPQSSRPDSSTSTRPPR